MAGQGTPKALLWRIGMEGSPRCSYLFGTVHSTDDRAFRFGDSVSVAAGGVDIVAGELDLADMDEEAGTMLDMMLMPDGKRLEDLYRRKDWRVVEAALKEKLGFQSTFVMRIKPFFVIAMLTGNATSSHHTETLDDELMGRARDNGQRVIGLETLAEQMRAMDVLTLEQQAAMLLDHIQNGDPGDGMDDLLDAYAENDLDRLMTVSLSQDALPEEMERSLLIDRNARMVHRMDSIMQGGETAFFAVGAAHLPRPTGIIARLKEKGYAVDPVFSPYRKPEERGPQSEDKH